MTITDLEFSDGYLEALRTDRSATEAYYTKSVVKTEQQKMLERLLDASGRTFESVADIACGGGTLTYHLRARYPSARFTLAEYNPDGLELARQLNGDDCEYVLGDIYDLKVFPNDCFDLVCCWQTFPVLDDPGRAMRELVRITTPGGLIFASALFNLHHDVDIYAKIIDHTHGAGKAGLPLPYNTYSVRTVDAWLEGLVQDRRLYEFVPEIDFVHEGRGAGTYTVQSEKGRLQISAGHLMNWAILEIVK
jgi:ubiquinone/menaquinone biosynthesis C-methylase UbiE